MAYTSGINQRVFDQTFYNTTISVNPSVSSSMATQGYVQTDVATINTDLTTINDELDALQSQVIALENVLNILQAKSQLFVGQVIFLPQFTPPTNYLLCDGSLVDVDTYGELWNVIEYRYGASQDLNQFALPDFQSRFPVGANNSANVTSNLYYGNGTFGASNEQQVYGNGSILLTKMPSHTHDIIDNGHLHQGTITDTLPSTTDYELLKESTSGQPGFPTNYAYTGVTLAMNGNNIVGTDPISNLSGINICPPFLSLNAFICYQN